MLQAMLEIAALFNNATVTWALVSEPHWRLEMGSDTADPAEYTELSKFPVHQAGPDGTIAACRQSISAILWVAVYGGQSEEWGILHPEPARPFDYGFLSNLPFVRIGQWPIINGKIVAEWVIASPSGHTAYQFPI